MDSDLRSSATVSDAENWLALSTGAALFIFGATRRSTPGLCVAAASAPLLYRGMTGRWPEGLASLLPSDDSRVALAGGGGIHVRDAIRLEAPIDEVYRAWRRLEHLPRFMSHLVSVTELPAGTSRWVAAGPAGVRVEWEAAIINDIPDQVLAWRSLPGSDVVTAGSVNFDRVRAGRSTQVTVNLQYRPPAGRAGALVAGLFGRSPGQTIREDLRRFKQQLEAGEAAVATSPAGAAL
jgi:uncharacterized membrane protein